MQRWQERAAYWPDLPYRTGGSLYLHLDDHDGQAVDLEAFAASHKGWGYDIETIVGDAIRMRAPNFKELPPVAAWAPCEAVAEGRATAKRLLDDCTNKGAAVLTNIAVINLHTDHSRVAGVVTEDKIIHADEVVIAAGAKTPELLADVTRPLPLTSPPGVLVHTKPTKPLIPCTTLARSLHIRQDPDGRIIAGEDFGGGSGHDDPYAAGEACFEKIRKTVKGAEDIELESISVGYRPTPADGFPAVGRPDSTPGLIIAVMHSGITLAPFVGEAIAKYIATGQMHALLRRYHPDRFHKGSTAAA